MRHAFLAAVIRLASVALLLLTACAGAQSIPSSPASGEPAAPSRSATPTPEERAQGYALRDSVVLFVFDAARYGVAPERVVVTGAFRGWSADMDDAAYALTPGPEGVWTLASPAEVGAATPFKFRIDDGRWLDPPAGTPNAEGGNLVYRFGETPVRVVAELRGERSVWVEVQGADRPFDAGAYRIVRWDGEATAVELVTPHEAHSALLVPAEPLATNQVHHVEVATGGDTLRGPARFDGLWRDLASAGPLGATVDVPCPQCARVPSTTVRLFAPRADSVTVHLYESRTGPSFVDWPMQRDASGVWSMHFPSDLRGRWYDFSVYGPDGPGSAFTNQTGERVSDPYALVSDDSWGRSRIWQDAFEPPRPVAGGRPAMEDVVAYEVHLQDFTDLLPVPEGVGPIEAFATGGLVNARGEPVGLDYLDRLGVNTVHLMPVQEYLHYPDDAWRAAFGDDPFMRAQGVADENYQWGYRTTHALAVESRFRSAGDAPGRERERFRDLVDALHARGLAVLIDVVFNHTGENMEGEEQLLTFNGIDKHYYYRLNEDGQHIGAFGNEVKSENRPMTQRWLLDQLRHYVDVFGVDGFRIDLAGQTDEQTLRWIQAELGRDVLIYGEPWIGSNDPDYEANPDWDWYKADSPITFFQDDARNALKGPTADPTPARSSRGYAGGDPEAREPALRAIANDYAEEPTPNAGINYLDIHDNWALADRFAACQTGDCAWDGRAGVRAAEMRLAAALLLTSLGPVVIHGGTEIARSKGLAPLPGEIGGQLVRREMALAPIYIKGRGDTYNLRAANRFLWDTVGQADDGLDLAELEAWWRGLIALRLSETGEVFRVGTEVPEGHVRVLDTGDDLAIGYTVGDRVLVLANPGDAAVDVELALEGRWMPVALSDASGGRADVDGLDRSVSGSASFRAPATGVGIWVRQ